MCVEDEQDGYEVEIQKLIAAGFSVDEAEEVILLGNIFDFAQSHYGHGEQLTPDEVLGRYWLDDDPFKPYSLVRENREMWTRDWEPRTLEDFEILHRMEKRWLEKEINL